MEITRTARPLRKRAEVRLWICGACDVVHMSADKSVLSFDRSEFSELANAVGDLYSAEWVQNGKALSILDLAAL
ncbi:MAG: hypothetical protein AB7Q37_09020 [Pyrinomonadaceae bacterium]